MHKKADILTAACGLFSIHGYYGTSMRALARKLDLREASLYAHIRSKEELLWEIVDTVSSLLLAQAASVPSDAPVEERLKLLIHGHLKVVTQKPQSAVVFFREWRFLRPAFRDTIKKRCDMYDQYFSQTISEGLSQGVFLVDDVELATQFVLSALTWTHQWLQFKRAAEESVWSQYSELILRALKQG